MRVGGIKMDVRNMDIYSVRDKFSDHWVDIEFMNGKKDHCWFFDISEEPDVDIDSDVLVYNHTGSLNYGNEYALNDIKSITINDSKH